MISSTSMNRISFEEVKEMNDKHNNDGISITKLSKEYKHGCNSIIRWFNSYGLPYKKRPNNGKVKYTDDFILAIYDEYKNGDSTVKIGERYKMLPSEVGRLFHKLNLPMRSNKINSRKYSYDEDFFEKIDTEEKAYWLGFIYADGYITKNENRLQLGIALSSIDKNHIEKFVKSINGNIEVKTYKNKGEDNFCNNTEYSRVIISSDKMCNDLIDKGVFLHKSNILKPPSIEKHLIRHFIRGYLDGDGSISFTKDSCTVSFLGTDELLTFIGEYFLENKLTSKAVKLEKRRDNQIVSYIRYGGNNQTKDILNHLYRDSNISLDRKKERYQKLITQL